MPALARILLMFGAGGVIVCLLLIGLGEDYNPILGGLHDEMNGTRGQARMEWEDERSTELLWLGVSGGAALLGAVLLAGARKDR
jgi:hypothetical protein